MNWKRAAGLAAPIVLAAAAARASPPPSLRVVGGETACPTPGQVATVLERLLARTKVTADVGPAGPKDATIVDEGSHFRVKIAGQERSFDDAARQCAERARHAAVFVALVLDPPMIPEPSAEPDPAEAAALPPPAITPVPTAEQPPPSRAERPAKIDLAFATVLQIAPGSGHRQTATTYGVAVRARAKRGLYLALGAGLLYGALQFGDVDATAWWVPLDVAGGFAARTGGWELGAEIGPSASILSILGRNLLQTQREVRLELGARGSATARFWLSEKFAVFLSAEVIARPSPYTLQVERQGDVGTMPALWLGGSAGFCGEL